MDELHAKIERLKARYFHETTMPPGDVLGICEDLRGRVAQLSIVWDAVEQLTARIAQLEKTAPSYRDPHAG